MHGRAGAVLVAALLAGFAFSGCDEGRLTSYFGSDDEPAAPASALSSAFDAATTGTITGRVTWDGAVPRVAPFHAPVTPLSELPTGPKLDWPNPHAPVVDDKTAGVAGAVVYLRGVDPAKARPWDLPPVTVAVRDCRYHVVQGDQDSITGFVRRGDAITVVSEQDRLHAVQARGAEFFTLMLPDQNRPRQRTLARPGIIELTSNTGQFWMRAHLFVADDPYLCRTDSGGRFTLPQIPAGHYELACWLPDWHEASHERDGETTFICRMAFRPAVVKVREVAVAAGRQESAQFSYKADDFGR
jgi:hypothetical protein